jgi:hypothetical protein
MHTRLMDDDRASYTHRHTHCPIHTLSLSARTDSLTRMHRVVAALAVLCWAGLGCLPARIHAYAHAHAACAVDPKGHALFVPPHSTVSNIKVIGWLYNEDGIWITSNTTLKQSFVRTNDDSIRLYAGVLDGFINRPAPPRGTAAWGITVEETVVSQLFNGGT